MAVPLLIVRPSWIMPSILVSRPSSRSPMLWWSTLWDLPQLIAAVLIQADLIRSQLFIFACFSSGLFSDW